MNDWVVTLAPVLGLLVDVIAQIGLAQGTGRAGLSIAGGALAGLVVTLALSAHASAELALDHLAANFLTSALTYLALAFGFWTFLNLNITSLRIRLLRELVRAPEGLSRAELLARYSAEEFLHRRLERLVAGKQICCVDGRWRLTSGTYFVLARTLRTARAIIVPYQREG